MATPTDVFYGDLLTANSENRLIKFLGTNVGVKGTFPPPPAQSRQVYLRGPGTESVEVTSQTEISKPFGKPRTLLIDGAEYAMGSIAQANGVIDLIRGTVREVAETEKTNKALYAYAQPIHNQMKTDAIQAEIVKTQTDEAAITKNVFDLRKGEFTRDIVPQIQERLNAAGLLDSGATPEALARALRGAGSATTVEEINKLEKSTLAGFDPLVSSLRQGQVGAANRTLGGASYDIDQMLNRLRMQAGQAEEPNILTQLLGVGTGIGGNLLAGSLRRKKPRGTPDYSNASSLDLYAPGSYRSSVPY